MWHQRLRQRHCITITFRVTIILLFICLFCTFLNQKLFAQTNSGTKENTSWALSQLQLSLIGGNVQAIGSINESFFNHIKNKNAPFGSQGVQEFLPEVKPGESAGLGLIIRFHRNKNLHQEWYTGVIYQQIKTELGRYTLTSPPDTIPNAEVVYLSTNQYVTMPLGWDYVFRPTKKVQFNLGLHSGILLGTASKANEQVYDAGLSSVQDSVIIDREYYAGKSFGFQLGISMGMKLKLTKGAYLFWNWQSQRSRLRIDGSTFYPRIQQVQFGLIYRLNHEI